MNPAPDTEARRIRHVLLLLAAALITGPAVLIVGLLLLPAPAAFLLGAAVYAVAQLISRWRWQIGLVAAVVLVYYVHRNRDRGES